MVPPALVNSEAAGALFLVELGDLLAQRGDEAVDRAAALLEHGGEFAPLV